MTAKQAGKELRSIIAKLKAGANYYDCERKAKPLIEIINNRSEELAKEFGVKAKKITFASAAR